MTAAEYSLGAIKAGICSDCAGDLQGPRLDRFWICAQCGRGFRLDGDRVTERIPMGPEWQGTAEMPSDAKLVRADGSVFVPERTEHDQAVIGPDVVALECEWGIAPTPGG